VLDIAVSTGSQRQRVMNTRQRGSQRGGTRRFCCRRWDEAI